MTAPISNVLGGFWMSQNWISPSGYISLGASPPATGAIRVDAASYSSILLEAANATCTVRLTVGTTGANIGTTTAHAFNLRANTQEKWSIYADAGGTATFASLVATARIVGGSTNGLAIRNSANTRDNFRVYDDGSILAYTDGTRTGMIKAVNSGEIVSGYAFTGSGASGSNVWLVGDQVGGTVGIKAGVGYYNGTQFYSALEVANVASGFGTLALMKSGGAVVVGTDPGGTQILRSGGGIRANSELVVGAASYIQFNARSIVRSPSDGVLTIANAAETDFGSLQFGGTTNAFPALKRSGSGLLLRNADDTAFSQMYMSKLTLTSAADSAGAGELRLGNATQSTVGAAGAASALPANPTGYLRFFIGATEYVLPYYAQA